MRIVMEFDMDGGIWVGLSTRRRGVMRHLFVVASSSYPCLRYPFKLPLFIFGDEDNV